MIPDEQPVEYILNGIDAEMAASAQPTVILFDIGGVVVSGPFPFIIIHFHPANHGSSRAVLNVCTTRSLLLLSSLSSLLLSQSLGLLPLVFVSYSTSVNEDHVLPVQHQKVVSLACLVLYRISALYLLERLLV